MKILCITTGLLSVNTYFLVNDENYAVMIDGGEKYAVVKDFIQKNNLKVTHELLTHAHFDHSQNALLFQKDGVKIAISKADAEKLIKGDTLAQDMGKTPVKVSPDILLSCGDILVLNGITIKVMLTKGHTDGSLCFIVENNIFSGDTLFYETFGRIDFPTGNFFEMKESIKKLYEFSDDTVVYPGHNQKTTIGHEKKYNQINEYL